MARTTTTWLDKEKDYYYTSTNIKKKNGKIRKIVSPSPLLKKYQRFAMHRLNYYFKIYANTHGVWDNFHGFIPNKNAVTAAKRHIGFTTTLMMDLKDFFDTVTRNMFDDMMFEMLDLNPKYLFHKSGKYAAQGFPSSPVLANIALVPAIVEFKQWMEANIGKEGEDWVITVYADDVVISYNYKGNPSEKDYVWRDIRDAFTDIIENYDFEIKPTKTRVRFAKYGARRILGINVWDDRLDLPRTTKRRFRAIKHIAEKYGPEKYIEKARGMANWFKLKEPQAA